MELQDIYFIAEIVGVIAVVVSLVFVGIQVRQNTRAAQVSNGQSAVEAWMHVTMNIASDPLLGRAIGNDAYPELVEVTPYTSEDERMAFWWASASLKVIEGNYLQWLDGNLSHDLWQGFREGLLSNFTINQSFSNVWDVNSRLYSATFGELVREIRQEAENRRSEILAAIGQ